MTDHMPLRSCIMCRRRRAKAELFRFISGQAGFLHYDARGTASGRGFYLCQTGNCLESYLRIPRKNSGRFREIVPESVEQLREKIRGS